MTHTSRSAPPFISTGTNIDLTPLFQRSPVPFPAPTTSGSQGILCPLLASRDTRNHAKLKHTCDSLKFLTEGRSGLCSGTPVLHSTRHGFEPQKAKEMKGGSTEAEVVKNLEKQKSMIESNCELQLEHLPLEAARDVCTPTPLSPGFLPLAHLTSKALEQETHP